MSNLPVVASSSNDWTPQDRVFVALYIELGRVVPAAQQAYSLVDPVKAGRMGNAFLRVNRNVLDLVLEREGLTDQALAKVIVGGLGAMKRTYAKHQGELGEHADDIDHPTRLNAAKLGLEVKGRINKHKQQHTDEDSQGPTGPVILPVRPGMELPATATILEAQYTEGGDRPDNEGGGESGSLTKPLPVVGGENISSEELDSGKKLETGENGNYEEEEW